MSETHQPPLQPAPAAAGGCPLCSPATEAVLWCDRRCRVVLAGEAGYPGFCRVIWQAHVAEMTDLAEDDRAHLLRVVLVVERALRDLVAPLKVNLASLGNQVAHLHWHVIPRFADDAHFPDAVWAARRREGVAHAVDAAALAERLRGLLPVE
ncbi:MAG: HIT family protein [Gammaproteobacteria bacterium]|nr:HIT family protein [Gammaproteobacteria bacterium]